MTKYVADSYFHIGASHLTAGRACQDYAAHGPVNGGGVVAIVSDGCSTGDRTDIGARVVALATQRAIDRVWWGTDRVAIERLYTLRAAQSLLGLTPRDMLATCVYAVLSEDEGFVHLHGDGVIAWIERNGTTVMKRYEWADNRPAYPIYELDAYTAFVREHGGDLIEPRLSVETFCVWPDETGTHLQKQEFPLGDAIRGITFPFSPLSLPRLVAVFSDGITQVDEVGWTVAVQECLAFKTLAGEFAKRRMIRFIKDSRAFGKGPLDDIAYAVIHAEDEE